MAEDDEILQIKKKRLEEMIRRQREAAAPRKQIVIEVFTSPSCPHCPRALAMAQELAGEIPGVQAIEVSTSTPQGMAKAALYDVKAVPTVFINRRRVFVGAPPSIEALRQTVQNI